LAARGRPDLQRRVHHILRSQIDALNEEWRGRKARDAIAKRFGERGPEPEVNSRPAVPRAELVRLPPSGRPRLIWYVGTSRLLTMPYGVEVRGLLKGSLASTALLPQSGNQLGDTWVVGHTPWVFIESPRFYQQI
jgi:hypothetical protein